jgi:uncharacterized protein (TIGR00251 family)
VGSIREARWGVNARARGQTPAGGFPEGAAWCRIAGVRNEMAGDMMTIEIKVQPNAKRSEIVVGQDGRVYVKVAAPPREGRANQAVVELIAERLGIRKSAVTIMRGHGSRNKALAIEGLGPEEIQRRLGA